MVESRGDERRDEDLDADFEAEPGTTRVLTSGGWEEAPYIAPGDDWELADDGSWVAPDGLTRTWLLGGAEPE
jgi:hypothetical protein